MAIACAYCGGEHDRPADVRDCWTKHGEQDIAVDDDVPPPTAGTPTGEPSVPSARMGATSPSNGPRAARVRTAPTPVDVDRGLRVGEADRRETVEAVTLLIAVECRTHLGDRPAFTQQRRYEQFAGSVVENRELFTVGARLPCFFDQPPSRLSFEGEIASGLIGGECEQFVGEPNALGRSSLVEEESCGDLAASDHVERIDDVVEPHEDGGISEFV